MRKLRKILFVALMILLFVRSAGAITTYYQPTPYPFYKSNGDPMPQDINIVHIWDGWFNGYYPELMTLQQDDKLQIGGWGDVYTSPFMVDNIGLPAAVTNAYLFLYALPSGATNSSQVSLWPITSSWNSATIGWNNFPSVANGYYWPVSNAVNTFRVYNLTGWYNEWKSGARPDNGILIWPFNNDGTQRFDKFASSRVAVSTDARYYGQGPVLQFDFTPTLQLKMPLPTNYQWLVTNEIGGYECTGQSPWPDIAHQNNNYFSIDFSWNSIPNPGYPYYGSTSDIPILAAAGGKVSSVDYNSINPDLPNGYYVVIDHDGDNNLNTGFSTRYLHLKYPPTVVKGQIVGQGKIIGYMGTTGKDAQGNPTSTGVHLHFGVRYQNSGASNIPELAKVVMEGKLLKSYQTACYVDSNGWAVGWIRYYYSTNIVQ